MTSGPVEETAENTARWVAEELPKAAPVGVAVRSRISVSTLGAGLVDLYFDLDLPADPGLAYSFTDGLDFARAYVGSFTFDYVPLADVVAFGVEILRGSFTVTGRPVRVFRWESLFLNVNVSGEEYREHRFARRGQLERWESLHLNQPS